MTLLDQVQVQKIRGPKWLGDRRQIAADQVRRTGLPTRKVEGWRFTPIAPIDSTAFAIAPAREPAELVELTAWANNILGDDDGCHRTWVVNGTPYAQPGLPAGVKISTLATSADEPEVRAHLGAHASPTYFGALNTAMFETVLVIQIEAGTRVTTPIHIGHIATAAAAGASAVTYPRTLVLVGERAEATLIESYLTHGESRLLVAPVTEVVLNQAARLQHVRVTETAPTAHHTAALAAHVSRDAGYDSRVITLGGALSRVEVEVVLDGEGAECSLLGAYHAGGRDHVDHQTRIDHAKPRGTSIENYRGIVDGRGQAVFDGTVIVRRDAQHTSAHQENRNLILSDGAGIHTKPHLEIDADDVVCSHGATVGALDDTQLFYLRARGIGEQEASAMLTFAFLREVTDAIGHAPVRERIERAVLARLPHGDLIQPTVPS